MSVLSSFRAIPDGYEPGKDNTVLVLGVMRFLYTG